MKLTDAEYDALISAVCVAEVEWEDDCYPEERSEQRRQIATLNRAFVKISKTMR